jgi:hypothetical protein
VSSSCLGDFGELTRPVVAAEQHVEDRSWLAALCDEIDALPLDAARKARTEHAVTALREAARPIDDEDLHFTRYLADAIDLASVTCAEAESHQAELSGVFSASRSSVDLALAELDAQLSEEEIAVVLNRAGRAVDLDPLWGTASLASWLDGISALSTSGRESLLRALPVDLRADSVPPREDHPRLVRRDLGWSVRSEALVALALVATTELDEQDRGAFADALRFRVRPAR